MWGVEVTHEPQMRRSDCFCIAWVLALLEFGSWAAWDNETELVYELHTILCTYPFFHQCHEWMGGGMDGPEGGYG